MPPRKRVSTEMEPPLDPEDDGPPASQQTGTQGTSLLAPQEMEKLANDLCRYVLLREHTKKPLPRADLKLAVLGADRKDPAGRIMKALIAAANLKLQDICGLELVVDSSEVEGVNGEEEAAASQGCGDASQGPSQATQGKASGAAKGNLLLLNRLKKAVCVPPPPSVMEYHALVEVVLGILAHNDNSLEENALFDWLAKIGVDRSQKLTESTGTADELVTKQMTHDAFMVRKKTKEGHMYYTAGPRAVLCRSAKAAEEFKKSLSDCNRQGLSSGV